MNMKRYALVRGSRATIDHVERYMPGNYKAVWEGTTDWHYSYQSNTWKQYPGMVDKVVLVEGRDDHGWTMEKYIIPRLASGMLRADEIDLSHPIMKEIPI